MSNLSFVLLFGDDVAFFTSSMMAIIDGWPGNGMRVLIDEMNAELTGNMDERLDGGRGILDEDFTGADINQLFEGALFSSGCGNISSFTLARATMRHRPRDRALS